MTRPTDDDLAWASQALDLGRTLEYVASVLEMKPRKARAAICSWRVRQRIAGATVSDSDVPMPKKAAIGLRKPPIDFALLRSRRRFLLGAMYSRHWDQIWFLRHQRMSGKTLRMIYGDDCLIWSVGGGIDVDIPDVRTDFEEVAA